MIARFRLPRPALLGALPALLGTSLGAAASPREHFSLDAGWKFHLGEEWPNALRFDKAGVNTGPASASQG